MFIKEVSIVGFKSFPFKTVFNFIPGITAIVGPNGCGKTNILDAIRWVFGEQNLSKLRCTKTEELISSGSSTRGFAEVKIIFENKNSIPELPEEIEIKRRFYLSGESEFYLNRNECRLKDIENIISKGSRGGRLYTLFDRDSLLEIINGKLPLYIETVAGIKSLKEKRKETERKIQTTLEDLQKVEEIIKEKRRFLRYLAKEKGKALMIKKLKNNLYTHKFKIIEELKNKEIQITEEKRKLMEKAQEIRAQLSEILKKQEREKKEMFVFSEKFKNTVQKREEIKGELEKKRIIFENNKKILIELNGKYQKNLEIISQLNKEIKSAEDEKKRVKEELEILENKRRRLDEEIERIEKTLFLKKDAFSQLEKRALELEEDSKKIKNIDSKIKKYKEQERKNLDLLTTLKEENRVLSLNLLKHEETLKKYRELLEKEVQRKKRLDETLNEIEPLLYSLQKIFEDKERIADYMDFNKEITKFLDVVFWDIMDLPVLEISNFKETKGSFIIKDWTSKEKINIKGITFKENPPQVIVKRLKEWKIVKTFEEALRVAKEEDINCITSEGIGVHKDGFIIIPREGVFEKRKRYEILKRKKDKITQEIGRIKKIIEDLKNKIEKEEKEVISLKNKISKNQFEINNIEDKHRLIHREISLLNESKQKILEKVKDPEGEIKNILQMKNYIQEEIIKMEKVVKEKREILHTTLKVISEKLGGLNGISSRIHFLKGNLKEKEKENMSLLREKEEVIRKIQTFEKEIERLSPILQEIEKELMDIERAKPCLKDYSKEIAQWNKKYEEIKHEINTLEEKLHTYSVERLSTEKEIEKLKEEGAELLEEASLTLEEAQKRLLKVGAVNPDAEIKYKEEKESFEEYKKQYQDIKNALAKLKILIEEIERDSKERFIKSFEKLRKEYKRLFPLFFDGGFGDIVLKDPSNPLESEIDIFAKPAGKDLKKLQQLSDGEKTMLGITILFSLYSVVSSDFLFIDELDAPLDDSNVIKFAEYLKKLSKDTQIVIITHNKKTIEYADYIYGITMEEPGISKVVSINLLKAKKLVDVSKNP